MKIKFEKLQTAEGKIYIDFGDEKFQSYNVVDVKDSGIEIPDNFTDYSKIRVKGSSTLLKNLDVIKKIELNNNFEFTLDTDTFGTSFPECVVGITIPDGITAVDTPSFYNPGNGQFTFTNISKPYPNLKTINLPNSITSIGNGVFQGSSNLTTINIPNTVVSIGECAFADCTSLATINIPDGVLSIGIEAFLRCSSLKNIIIPNSITAIEERTFGGSGLTSIKIPNSITRIGLYAFINCQSLTTVTIPNSVVNIETCAFSTCSNLKTINYEGTEEQWNLIDKDKYWNYNCPSDIVINYNYTE